MEEPSGPGPDKASIKPLRQNTVKQIGSSQVLVDPSSVVKELMDNALDARATAIFVEISANTIDLIQVRDNGHGVAQEDRPMLCRRHCTSKIRGFDDLKEIGGVWLGFRGEALASMAEMSSSLGIITRVEGEPVAVLLKIRRDGQIEREERASHPVGTSVKVTDFFTSLPVRKQAALKHSARYLAKVKRLMQAYALSRPAVRFCLRILKAKADKGNWIYAPKPTANVEDAAFKVIGRECASQCDWTVLESNGFGIQAFLPKSTANGAKMANEGQFLSVDSRPVSASRGTLKQFTSMFKGHFRKSNVTFDSIKDPFMWMNIVCPPGSYDPNIEPAKDDVLFEDSNAVIVAVEALLTSYYPVSMEQQTNEAHVTAHLDPGGHAASSPSTPTRSQFGPVPNRAVSSNPTKATQSFSIHEDDPDETPLSPRKRRRTWRSDMYGIDEEDLDLLTRDDRLSDQEENEEDQHQQRNVALSNPWTIAKMNASVKSTGKAALGGQLLTPLKEKNDTDMNLISPLTREEGRAQTRPSLLTPLPSSSPVRQRRTSLDDALERSIQRLPIAQRRHSAEVPQGKHVTDEEVAFLQSRQRMTNLSDSFTQPTSSLAGTPLGAIPQATARPRRNGWKQRNYENQIYTPLSSNERDVWFDHLPSAHNSTRATRRRRQAAQEPAAPFNAEPVASSQRSTVLDAAENLVSRLTAKRNRDIREFVALRPSQQMAASDRDVTQDSDTMPRDVGAQNYLDQLRAQAESGAPDLVPQNTEAHAVKAPLRKENAVDDTEAGPEPASSRHRRRTSTGGGLYRSKSSKLPLERIPRDYRTQNLSLIVRSSVPRITESIWKLDWNRNALEWGYPPDDAFDIFATAPTASQLQQWCEKLDACLRKMGYEKDETEEASSLEKAIQNAFSAKEDDLFDEFVESY